MQVSTIAHGCGRKCATVFALILLSCCGCKPRESVAPPGHNQIAGQYAETARRIIEYATSSNEGYKKLEDLCLTVGHRLSGSANLDRALEWAVETLRRDDQENIRIEPVMVPHWVRGEESCTLVEPRIMPLAMLGLGGSIATPPGGITAQVLAVRDEDDLAAKRYEARGRIVLFNNPMPRYDPEKGAGYGSTVRFRGKGASLAAEHGAVACLIRSVTAHSLRSPHTGAMRYSDNVPRIPAAAISTEDAEMIHRMQSAGIPVTVNLQMSARDEGLAESGNVIAEIVGAQAPWEVVVIGGHIDSWDVGQGAHDDGGGAVMCIEAINVLRKLGLRPRRTIRVVLFTNEENGLAGAKRYAEDHASELSNHVAAIESDSGVFQPLGFSLDFPDESRRDTALAQLAEITSLLAPIDATKATKGGSGADVGQMKPAGVPGLGLNVDGSKYFDYHHTHADTIDKVDPQDMSRCVAAMAVTSYILADMPGRLGHTPESKTP